MSPALAGKVFTTEPSRRPHAHFVVGLSVILILSSISCLYILKVNSLSVASFTNIFSHSMGCLFILFMVSFAVQELLSLIRFHLFIFAFVSIILGVGSKKILLRFMSQVFCLFSSRSFIVSGLKLMSLIYFEFIFVCVVRECSTFHSYT